MRRSGGFGKPYSCNVSSDVTSSNGYFLTCSGVVRLDGLNLPLNDELGLPNGNSNTGFTDSREKRPII